MRPKLLCIYRGLVPSKESKLLFRKFSRMVELEVTAGALVIIIAGVLGSISPPGPDGAYRVSKMEFKQMMTPDLPTTHLTEGVGFVGASTRTLADLRYAEFTHNWSGILIILLGICWWGESFHLKFGRAWPFSLVPFALFIAIAADPEVWITGNLSFREMLRDPQIIEHQLGGLLLLVMLWFAWRERKVKNQAAPLGYTLPVLMVIGSLMLLSHAHTTLTASDELTTRINVQHAILGLFGLFAGTARWFQLRGLLQKQLGGFLWPGAIVALGIFMAFFYREVI